MWLSLLLYFTNKKDNKQKERYIYIYIKKEYIINKINDSRRKYYKK